jgi:ribonucleoside-diphosphate reductase alpha chain
MEFVEGYRQTNSPQRGAKAKPAAHAVALSAAPASSGTNGGNGDSATDGSKAKQTEPSLSASAATVTTPMATKLALPLTTPQSDASVSPHFADRYSHLAALQLEHQRFQTDAPICDNCGALTVPNGNCYRCFNCGSSMGCS